MNKTYIGQTISKFLNSNDFSIETLVIIAYIKL